MLEIPRSGGTSVPTCIQETIARSAEAPAILLGNFRCPRAVVIDVPKTVWCWNYASISYYESMIKM